MPLAKKSRPLIILFGILFPLLLATGCERKLSGSSAYDTTVNGQPVSSQQFIASLQLYAGSAVMNRLIEHKLILQEADKQKIVLNADELKEPLKQIYESDKAAPFKAAMEEEVRASLLLRAILLRDVTEEKKKSLYEIYKGELTRCELSIILLPDPDVAKQVQIALETGTPFEALAASSSTDETSKLNEGRIGFLTWLNTKDRYTRAVADAVFRLKEGQTSKPLALPDGRLGIFRVGKKLDSYEQLKGAIEDIIVSSTHQSLTYRLFCEADIRSPYLPNTRVSVPLPGEPTSKGPKKAPHGAATENAPVAPVESTPDPIALPTAAPADIPLPVEQK